MITFGDFKKVEITVGKILSAEKVPETDKLLKLSVDFGLSPLVKGVPNSDSGRDVNNPRSEDGAPPLVRGTTPGLGDSATPFGKGDTRTPMDEKNMRALVRIAAGTKYGEEELRNAFEDLPLGLRQSLSSVDTANSIQEIAKKYLLHVDQMAALASETGLVLLGLTHPADFIKNLAGRLRVPEERAKEIARETSSQILVKVRESLRSLHAEVVQPPPVAVGPRLPAQTSFSIPKPSVVPTQRPTTYNQQPTTAKPLERTTPAVSEYGIVVDYGTPFNKGDGDTASSSSSAKRYQSSGGLNASLNTPYSVGAKWNMGENVLKKQTETTLPESEFGTPFRKGDTTPPVSSPLKRGGGEDEALSRADVLRDIENPKGIVSVPKILAPTLPNSSLTARSYPPAGGLKASPVGPTGWKPSASAGRTVSPLTRGALASSTGGVSTTPPVSEYGTPFGKGDKTRPQSESSAPPQSATIPLSSPLKRGGEEEKDFLDQKLQAPMAIPKEEKRFTTDPYREPTN